MTLLKFMAMVLVLCGASALWADDNSTKPPQHFPIPDRYSLVNDYQGVLSQTKAADLRKKLQRLEKKNGTQIVLLIVPTTGDMTAATYATKVAEKWDIGNNGEGNGVLFLIAANNGGHPYWQILTGPGIAGALPDIKVRHIVTDITNPRFMKGEWIQGIEETLDALIFATSKEETKAAIYPEFIISLSRDQVIALGLAALGVLYAGFLGFRYLRQKNKGTS